MERRQILLQVQFIMAKEKDSRIRNWSCIVYPDSVKENWREILDDMHLKWVESPLHDKDKNPDGEDKKPHIHVGMFFDGKKSYDQVNDICSMIGATIPVRMQNPKGFVRYLAHMDNPEKAQYNVNDIICHGGFDKESYIDISNRDKRLIIKDMMDYIEANEITSFYEFSKYCYTEHFDDWSEIITDKNTLFIKEYIKSYAWRHNKIDAETGEVISTGEYLEKK